MKRKILYGSLALVLGLAIHDADALTVQVTSMDFGDHIPVLGSLSDSNGGSSTNPYYGEFSGVFFNAPFIFTGIEYFDDSSGATLHYTGIDYGWGTYDYAFSLAPGQVAWGGLFDWSMGTQPSVLNIMDCDEDGDGNIESGEHCTGIGTPMQAGPFPGQAPAFNGIVSVVPLPASVWLFVSSLTGLLWPAIVFRKQTGKL